MIKNGKIADRYSWFNEPEYEVAGNRLKITTSPDTDFWQRTHYGFRRDNGHCLLTAASGDFTLTVRTEFAGNRQYDQCGLMIRLDEENWIKASTEYETADHSRLGSVVTNKGYSDWATVDIYGGVTVMWYRIRKESQDFFLDYSKDGKDWHQLRIAHLHEAFSELYVGVYACSPMESSFTAFFDNYFLE
ncbi:MAG: DUF1349 domain-containing protein [Spirochaetales bacterium]|nr:DUF1349 domain-containing protein [Spirochaetales bacterium]